MTTEDLATRIMALINSKPQSPRREEILAVLAQAAPSIAQSSLSYLVCPVPQTGVQPVVRVEHGGLVTAQGWSVSPHLKPEHTLVAVTDWLRDRAIAQSMGH